LLQALHEMPDTHFFFTKANADPEGRVINSMIDDFVKDNSHIAFTFHSLGYLRYLSLMQIADVVVGNSSSGIIEAPSVKTATVNIGNRQKGRIAAKSVIHCEPKSAAIKHAVNQAVSADFQTIVSNVDNPYGQGHSAEQIAAILKKTSVDFLIPKVFHRSKPEIDTATL